MNARRNSSLPFALLLFVSTTAFGQGTLYMLRTNGPTANRLNLVFLAEGYTNGQTAKFTNDARNVLQQLLLTQPYREYTNYLNAFAIFVASAQTGGDHPSSNVFRNTYFNSTYDSYGTARLLTIPPNDRDPVYANGRGKVDALLQTHRPDYDVAMVIVNDPVYGGSGGPVPVTSTDTAAPEIAIHEMGHSFAGLGDEYSSPFPGYPDTEEPNTTRQTNRAQIKWNSWILPTTPLPTPDIATFNTVVGLFEGAHYHDTGWYRPKRDCKMRSLDVPFCEVCAQTIVLALYGAINPIDSISPPTNNLISITNAATTTLSVTRLQPSTHQLRVQWYTNNTLWAGATNPTLTLAAWDLPPGTNTIRAEVSDTTALVRNDPSLLLRESRTWRVKSAILAPRLAIARNGGQVLLDWPMTAIGFELQAKSNLTPASAWTTLSLITNQAGASYPVAGAPRYFRLRQP